MWNLVMRWTAYLLGTDTPCLYLKPQLLPFVVLRTHLCQHKDKSLESKYRATNPGLTYSGVYSAPQM